jgi:hypothetical protein
VFDSGPSHDIRLVMGCLNVKMEREEICSGIIGKHSVHQNTNGNGQKLTDFAASKNMIISSNCFPHKDIQKQTWRSSDGLTTKQIDHVLIEKRSASNIMAVKSCRGVNSDSDHFLMKVRYRCQVASRSMDIMKYTRS